MRPNRPCILGLTLGAIGLTLSACTPGAGPRTAGPAPRLVSLVAYDSCDEAVKSLKAAARIASQYTGTKQLDEAPGAVQAPSGAARSAGAAAPGAATPAMDFSGTNVHEPGVDEPDLAKTDGSRILTVTNGVLRVVDVASRRLTAELSLPGHPGAPAELLLSGDRALVLFPSTSVAPAMPRVGLQPSTSELLLVDLSGRWPRLEGTLTVDGSLIDARQVGAAASLVVRSTPRLDADSSSGIDSATISDWLPRFSLSVDGRTSSGRVDCQRVSRPLHSSGYSGLTMLTVYSLDLDAPVPTVGQPATVVADGKVVYGSGERLYIAADDAWMAAASGGRPASPVSRTSTQVYEFDVSEPGRPTFEASAELPGWLIDQYALSEYDGSLRVVTTTVGPAPGGASAPVSETSLHVLKQRGEALTEVGRVDGLGRGERVYSVRFVGPTGYVVTFRQTDPLYVVDLRDPSNPTAVGELQLTGYSAYLHPVGAERLIGVGQEASARGRVLGTQVSLFDVSDPAKPGLLARYQLKGGQSEAEIDPHAFLFWPKTGLVLIPITPNRNGALALTVDGYSIHELGRVGPGLRIRRALVVGDTLWTVADTGLGASRVTTLASEGWIPFSAGVG